jgi:uncharacterized protein involved in exopolysaccharide biosynthesis
VLAKQYEIAKIDEAKDAGVIQVLDSAVIPERKSRPKRLIIVILTTLVSGLVAVVLALVRDAIDKARQDPRYIEDFRTLRALLPRSLRAD